MSMPELNLSKYYFLAESVDKILSTEWPLWSKLSIWLEMLSVVLLIMLHKFSLDTIGSNKVPLVPKGNSPLIASKLAEKPIQEEAKPSWPVNRELTIQSLFIVITARTLVIYEQCTHWDLENSRAERGQKSLGTVAALSPHPHATTNPLPHLPCASLIWLREILQTTSNWRCM